MSDLSKYSFQHRQKIQKCLDLARKWAFLPEARYVEVTDKHFGAEEAGEIAMVVQKIGSWVLYFVVTEDEVDAYTLDTDGTYVYLGSQEEAYERIASL